MEIELPTHRPWCEYEKSGHDIWTYCTCRVRYCDKPFTHWQRHAQELFVEMLVRAATGVDRRSIIGRLASDRMLEIARRESEPALFEVLEKRDRAMRGLVHVFNKALERFPNVKEALGFR